MKKIKKMLVLLPAMAMLSGICLAGCSKEPAKDPAAADQPEEGNNDPAGEIGRASCRERV